MANQGYQMAFMSDGSVEYEGEGGPSPQMLQLVGMMQGFLAHRLQNPISTTGNDDAMQESVETSGGNGDEVEKDGDDKAAEESGPNEDEDGDDPSNAQGSAIKKDKKKKKKRGGNKHKGKGKKWVSSFS